MDEGTQTARMAEGYIIVLCSILIAFIYKMAIAYLDMTSDVSIKLWDAKTCTPADYTIEIPITKSMLQNYSRNKSAPKPLDSHIREVLIDRVSKLPPVEEGVAKDDVNIAIISYGYHNSKMIKLLKKRGNYLGNGKINDFMKNEKMSRGLVLSNAEFEKMKQPVCAFVTFTTHEAAMRCQKYLMRRDPVTNKKNKEFRGCVIMGNKADIKAASEPSNVIWENLEVDMVTKSKRFTIVLTVICVFIVACFLLFTSMKYKSG
jgi:hypothetical protein